MSSYLPSTDCCVSKDLLVLLLFLHVFLPFWKIVDGRWVGRFTDPRCRHGTGRLAARQAYIFCLLPRTMVEGSMCRSRIVSNVQSAAT